MLCFSEPNARSKSACRAEPGANSLTGLGGKEGPEDGSAGEGRGVGPRSTGIATSAVGATAGAISGDVGIGSTAVGMGSGAAASPAEGALDGAGVDGARLYSAFFKRTSPL